VVFGSCSGSDNEEKRSFREFPFCRRKVAKELTLGTWFCDVGFSIECRQDLSQLELAYPEFFLENRLNGLNTWVDRRRDSGSYSCREDLSELLLDFVASVEFRFSDAESDMKNKKGGDEELP
jgi:hypothetical protein